jgi:hypothetical protein
MYAAAAAVTAAANKVCCSRTRAKSPPVTCAEQRCSAERKQLVRMQTLLITLLHTAVHNPTRANHHHHNIAHQAIA